MDNRIERLMRHMSQRMLTVAGLCTNGSSVADIGTDHGYVPIYLFLKGISDNVIAADVRKSPLKRAETNIREYGAAVSVRLSDGLKGIKRNEVQTVICAGMGGLLILDILSVGRPRELGVKELVLQPQSEIESLREYLRKNRYTITDERFLQEEGKYYSVIKAVVNHAEADASDSAQNSAVEMLMAADCDRNVADRICDRFGPCLLLEKNSLLKEYMESMIKKYDMILKRLQKSNTDNGRESEILEDRNDTSIALEIYGGKHANTCY